MTAQIEPKLVFMRPGFAISCIGHVAVLTIGLMFAGANPFESAPADAITVEIVSPNEVEPGPGEPESAPSAATAEASSFDLPAPTQQPQSTASAQPPPTASAQSQQQPPPTASAQPQQQHATQQALATTQALPTPSSSMPWFQPLPETAPPADDAHEFNPAEMFAMPLALPDGKLGGSFDAPAFDKASIPSGDIAAFHDRLKTCSKLPASVNVTDNVRAILRIFLKPDGTLAAPPQPLRIEGVSRGGGDLYVSIVAALRKCQPYNMLPPDKYDEWKVFDLTFTPQSFGGG